MKKISLFLLVLICASQARAVTNYTITSNKSWSSAVGGSCYNCNFAITGGVTFTIDVNITCGTCTFTDGTVTASSSFTCQTCTFTGTNVNTNNTTITLQSATTNFNGSTINSIGTGGIQVTAGLALTNATYNLTDNAQLFMNGGSLNVSNSSLYLYGNSYLTANSGPVTLSAASHLVAGNGSSTSSAYIYFNGPSLVLSDANSSVSIANKNNYYFNYGQYSSTSNSKTYTTSSNNLNCGGAGQHACNMPYLYGCAMLSASGMVACTSLTSTIESFSSTENNHAVLLNWIMSNQTGVNHFIVERSTDASTWTIIGSQAADNYNGTYQFTDMNTSTGTFYYRLQVVSDDGTIQYSPITKNVFTDDQAIRVFPNPATGSTFNIEWPASKEALIQVFTAEGELIYSVSLSNQTKFLVRLPATANSSHMLVVRVITNEKTSSFNVINRG